MSDFGNKEVFSENLRRYIEQSGKTRKDIINDLGVRESTFNTWCRGEYYPRIDKIEMLADYFGCTKSDLIERREETFVVNKYIKDAIIALHKSRPKTEIVDFVVKCGDMETELLITMVRALKGNENEPN